jgi:hypothetical protein
MTPKSLHDHHMARLACARAVREMSDPAMSMLGPNGAAVIERLLPTSWEIWMKLVKTSAIAVAITALLAGPVLAQGASSDAPARGGAMGKTQMQGGAAGSMEADAPAGGTHKAAGAKPGSKTTVGAGSGAKGTATTPPASGR